MQRQMLSKDDEAAAEEVPVRREDQEKINRFSRLHQREAVLEQQLAQKRKDKDDVEEISTELELADVGDEERVPYKVGDCFFSLPVEDVQQLLAQSTARIDGEVDGFEQRLAGLREEMGELKVALYGRFGRSINLEM